MSSITCPKCKGEKEIVKFQITNVTEVCSQCNGGGIVEKTCKFCKGSGKLYVKTGTIACTICKGTGKFIPRSKETNMPFECSCCKGYGFKSKTKKEEILATCPLCNGKGIVNRNKIVKLFNPLVKNDVLIKAAAALKDDINLSMEN
jgi:DnaJ-class molecular chaperone